MHTFSQVNCLCGFWGLDCYFTAGRFLVWTFPFGNWKESSEEYLVIDPIPTQESLAQNLGLTRETIVRTFRKLVDDGIIERHSKTVFIRNPSKLEKIAISWCVRLNPIKCQFGIKSASQCLLITKNQVFIERKRQNVTLVTSSDFWFLIFFKFLSNEAASLN